jgi:2',3'-cyclic-nucleotide 2'-phosphodiesterase (5'-nucleotidase family)
MQPGNFRSKDHNVSYVPPKVDRAGVDRHTHTVVHDAAAPKAVHDTTVVQPKSNGKWKRVEAEVETRFIIPQGHSRIKNPSQQQS